MGHFSQSLRSFLILFILGELKCTKNSGIGKKLWFLDFFTPGYCIGIYEALIHHIIDG